MNALKMFFGILVTLMVISAYSSESEPDVELLVSSNGYTQIRAISDEVTIHSIDLNRGNCKLMDHVRPEYPFTLKYGQTKGLLTYCGSSLREVVVETDVGTMTFNVE